MGNGFGARGVLAEMGVVGGDDFPGDGDGDFHRQFALHFAKAHGAAHALQLCGVDAAITQAIIAMAHGLRISVIAEGVETREQLEFLRAHGCDEIQGYYFSKPVPEDEFIRLLEENAGAGAAIATP